MDCIECKAKNPDENHFCGRCGAKLGRSLAETVQKEFRDRQAIEVEITESVIGRLMKWATWLGSIATLFVALFLFMLHLYYRDVGTAVEAGKNQINTAVQQGRSEIDAVRKNISGLSQQATELTADFAGYKKMDNDIGRLRQQVTNVQSQILDLGNRDVKARSFTTTGKTGSSYVSFNNLGCPPSTSGSRLTYCSNGSPPFFLFQLTSTGELTAVSSRSPTGFQDLSSEAKPSCTASKRGTFLIEKGTMGVADKPFVCANRLLKKAKIL
jgi:hypothetical protein